MARTGTEMTEAHDDNAMHRKFVLQFHAARTICCCALRLQTSAIRQFCLVTMSATFNRWQFTTPASISSGMIAPVKIQVTGIRPLDKLSLIAE
jgi:hypothetical protein